MVKVAMYAEPSESRLTREVDKRSFRRGRRGVIRRYEVMTLIHGTDCASLAHVAYLHTIIMSEHRFPAIAVAMAGDDVDSYCTCPARRPSNRPILDYVMASYSAKDNRLEVPGHDYPMRGHVFCLKYVWLSCYIRAVS